MNARARALIWGGAVFVVVLIAYGVRGILFPFILAAAMAYLLNPLCVFLERHRFSRVGATTLVTAVMALTVLTAAVTLPPLMIAEVQDLAARAPTYEQALRAHLATLTGPIWTPLQQWLDDWRGGALTALTTASATSSPNSLALVQGTLRMIARLFQSIGAVVSTATTVAITPMVTFYLLRDWPRLLRALDDLLPRRHGDTLRALARECDAALAGFLRGQSLVCLSLGLFYAIGLTLVGLRFGFTIGLLTGLLSFIPWFGMLLGFGVGMVLAVAQFGSWEPVALTALVFGIGQILEGYVLTPRLVGGRVGLHPVWIIFALMAGGALLGFVGVLLAAPTAAIAAVLVRFGVRRYRAGAFYRADHSSDPSGIDGDRTPPDTLR